MKVHELMIVDQVDSLLAGAGDEAVRLHLAIERQLQSVGDPEMSWHMETAETGFFRALAGKRRDVLVIEHSRFGEYLVLISARAHGRMLQVGWVLLATPRIVNRLKRVLRFEVEAEARFEIGADHDVFDGMDLRAFVGITRLALRQAIRDLTGDEAVVASDEPG